MTAETELDACSGAYVGVARLADDRAGLGGDLALGCNAERALTLTLDGGDLDGDGRAELSVTIEHSATFVIDVERFETQLAAWGPGLVLEHPQGTGLMVPFCRPEGEYIGPRSPSDRYAEPPSESFDFVDVLEGCEASVVPYDPAGDCWRYGLRP